MQKEQFCWSI